LRLVSVPFRPSATIGHMFGALARLGWFVLVWSIFGTAITRHVALTLIGEDVPGLVGAIWYGSRKWLSSFNAVAFVLLGILALSVPGAVLGLLMRSDWGLALVGALLNGQRLMAAEVLSAEERLAAVRQSLLQAALEAPTQVVATSWIDGDGVLREMNSFRNGMQVRGVRIVSYERDAKGQPSAAVQWDKVADAADKAPPVCPPPSDRFKHLVTLRWDVPTNLPADQLWMLESLRVLVELLDTPQSEGSAKLSPSCCTPWEDM
jgi:hypothetical protein